MEYSAVHETFFSGVVCDGEFVFGDKGLVQASGVVSVRERCTLWGRERCRGGGRQERG